MFYKNTVGLCIWSWIYLLWVIVISRKLQELKTNKTGPMQPIFMLSQLSFHKFWVSHWVRWFWCHLVCRRGGTDLERGCGDLWPWRPPFHASPVVRKGPISRKSQIQVKVNSQDPLLRIFWNFSLYCRSFCPNFSSLAPKFWNFQFTRPVFQRQKSVRKPHTLEIRAAHPYLKRSRVPPLGVPTHHV